MKFIKEFEFDKPEQGYNPDAYGYGDYTLGEFSRKRKVKPKFYYRKMMDYLEKKYGFKSRGFRGIPIEENGNSYEDWCYLHNIPEVDPEGKKRIISDIFRNMYKEAEDGEKTAIPYMDFLHYLADINEDAFYNGAYILIPREVIEEECTGVGKWKGWEQDITDLIFYEFGKYAKKGYLEVWIKWSKKEKL
jgi:hypothetical protein